MQEVNKILQYLKSSPGKGLFFRKGDTLTRKGDTLTLKIYTDAYKLCRFC